MLIIQSWLRLKMKKESVKEKKKMKDVEELVQMADRLCEGLDNMARNEKRFCIDLCAQLEIWSWDTYRISQTLRNINQEV